MTHRRATAAVALAALLCLTGCAASPVDVKGRVLGLDGEPRAGCSIVADALSGGPVAEFAQVSGSDGRHSRSFPPGRYRITAYCGDETGSVTVDASTPEGGSTDIVVGE